MTQSTSAGATTRPPARSPSHQVVHTAMKLDGAAWPPSIRASTPMVALIGVATAHTTAANLATPTGLRNASTPPARVFTSHAPANASSMLPAPIGRETQPELDQFAAMAPARTAGQ